MLSWKVTITTSEINNAINPATFLWGWVNNSIFYCGMVCLETSSLFPNLPSRCTNISKSFIYKSCVFFSKIETNCKKIDGIYDFGLGNPFVAKHCSDTFCPTLKVESSLAVELVVSNRSFCLKDNKCLSQKNESPKDIFDGWDFTDTNYNTVQINYPVYNKRM